MRSVWKNDIIDIKSNLKVLRPGFYSVDKEILNKRISVYNGKLLLSLIVRDYMIGYKFSNFISSKKTGFRG